MSDTPAISDKQSAYRVLARKYRPSDFSTLIGQEPMVQTLKNAFEAGRIAQAWMLTGVRGVGKTTTARILARALNYKRDDVDKPSVDLSEPGEHCAAIMEGRHVDIIEMDAASHTGIDDIKQIIDGVRYAPVSARYKVYIIDEIHMLSEKAFNALLKTLEEPPPHAKFIFATTEIRKVPITVLSRCQRFDLRRVEADVLARHLADIARKENVDIDEASLAMIARAGEGSVRDALSILDQAIAHTNAKVDEASVRAMLGLADRGRIVGLFEKIMKGDVVGALDDFKGLYDEGADPAVVLTDLAQFTHLVTRLRFVPKAAELDASLSLEERDRGLEFSKALPIQTLGRAWQMLLKGISETELAARPFSAAEMVLIRLAHAADLPTLDQAMKRLEAIEQDPASAIAAPPAAMASMAQPSAKPSSPTTNPVNAAPTPQTAATADPPPNPAPTMRLVAGGGEALASQALEIEAPPVGEVQPEPEPEPELEAKPEPAPQTEAAVPAVPLNSLHDIAALCEKNRDPLMKVQVRRCVRLVSIEPGRLTVQLTDDAPNTLLGDLSKKLQKWTGARWMVSTAREGGGATLDEEDQAKKSALFTDAERDPVVSKLLDQFPGAKIIDVRLAGADDDDGAALAALDDSAGPVEAIDDDDV
ncbi:MAG: DNA polymerase III subunit gamma/tau [Pseudomonadota bacterium]